MKNKISLFVLFFVFIFFFFGSKASAGELIPQDVLDSALVKNYGINNFLLFRDSDGNYILTVEENGNKAYGAPYDVQIYTMNSWHYVHYQGIYGIVSPSWWTISFFKWQDNNWVYIHSGNKTSIGARAVIEPDLYGYTLVYASKDVHYSGSDFGDLNGTVFFPAPPKLSPLGKAMAALQMTEVMTEVLGILPIAMVCLVGWVALRKGLAMVSLLLRKS